MVKGGSDLRGEEKDKSGCGETGAEKETKLGSPLKNHNCAIKASFRDRGRRLPDPSELRVDFYDFRSDDGQA